MANKVGSDTMQPQTMSFANSTIPLIGSLVDYLGLGYHYLVKSRSCTNAEKLHLKITNARLSSSFLAMVCLLLGFVANIKLEVVRFDEKSLDYDLHIMLMSKNNNIYIDEIDPSRVMCCFEASDCIVLLISCSLVWFSSYSRSPMSEYMFLPWLGMTLRGLLLRQVSTASALVYAIAVIDRQHVNMFFLIAISFLFLLEARICVEIMRVMRARWERREWARAPARAEVHTLWSSEDDDVVSVEMRNFVY